uniref:Uncharacterized protein n=1 Tax=Geospiza parvula TaxID=87175 RepID=A0A8C3MLN6_GEOPR
MGSKYSIAVLTVSIAAEHRNMPFVTRHGSCILPPTNNFLEDSDSYKHSVFYRLRLHSCTPILVLGAHWHRSTGCSVINCGL